MLVHAVVAGNDGGDKAAQGAIKFLSIFCGN
jgi:hypothetical protein